MLYKGVYKKGVIQKTKNQRKKHISQMSKEEINKLVKAIQAIDLYKLRFLPHSLNKKHNRFSMKIVYRMLNDKNVGQMIVEYNSKNSGGEYDCRVLLRDSQEYKILMYDAKTNEKKWELCNLCVVISFVNNYVVTTYWNKVDDHHQNINLHRYDEELEVIVPGEINKCLIQ